MRIVQLAIIAALPWLMPLGVDVHAQSIRDSAGIRIVTNPPRSSARIAFRLDAKPVYEVGGLQDNVDEEFDANQGYLRATWLSNGGLAVIDVWRVHYFDANGKRVRIVGQKGSGPADFKYLMSVCATRGDTVVVVDGHNRRLSILDPTGTVIRTIPQATRASSSFDSCLGSGLVLSRTEKPRAVGASGLATIQGIRMDGVASTMFGEHELPPFDMAVMPEHVMIGWDRGIVLGNPMRPELHQFDATGRLTTIVRLGEPSEPISTGELERRWSMTIPTNTPATERKERMDRMRSLPHVDQWPHFGRAHVDAAGRLWVADVKRTWPSPDFWTAYDPGGRMIGRLEVPAPDPGKRGLQVISFGRDQVLVRRSDDDGAAYLSSYRLLPVR